MNKKRYFYSLFALLVLLHNSCAVSLNILHLSFHRGCINEIEFIAEQLNFTVTSLFIPGLKSGEWDGYASGNALYNVGHDRALKIWEKHKDFFNQFDVVITSDTAPLSRIFLQNNFTKPLIVWICNRFDYCDTSSLDCVFPDEEYYQLLREAKNKKNVYLIPYNSFESFYALQKNIECSDMVIKPSGVSKQCNMVSAIPSDLNKCETFFIPPYLNDASVKVAEKCGDLNIPVYKGRYNGPQDLKDFKGIIHIPYAWSNVAFFENIQSGLPYFIPSSDFIEQLYKSGLMWWPSGGFFLKNYQLSEWYNQENKEIITYFDSWEDLKNKIEMIDFDALRSKIKRYAHEHLVTTLDKWRSIFDYIEMHI